MAEVEKLPPPPGVKPMFIQASSLEKYDMKTGESISDTVPYKEFVVTTVLAECLALGFMSDFHAFAKDIEAYQSANGGAANSELTVLVVRDVDEKYGDNFYICLTAEAREREFSQARADEEAAAAAIAAAIAEAEAKAAAEYARLNAVFEDIPLYPRPYASASAAATFDEIASKIPDRPLLLCRVVRPRSTFGGRCPAFASRDSDTEAKAVDLRSWRTPDFETRLRLRDVGLQGAPMVAPQATQTAWHRPVNKAAQFDGFDPERKARERRTASLPDTKEAMGLRAFLSRARVAVEVALQQNEAVDVFRDAFAEVGGEEGSVGQKGDNDLKELRTFNDIKSALIYLPLPRLSLSNESECLTFIYKFHFVHLSCP